MPGSLKAVFSSLCLEGLKVHRTTQLVFLPRRHLASTVVINSHHSESGYVYICLWKCVYVCACTAVAAAVVIDEAVVVKSHHI